MSPTQNLLPDTPTHALIRPAIAVRSPRPRRPPPHAAGASPGSAWSLPGCCSAPCSAWGSSVLVLLGVLLLAAFQTLVRRRSLRSLLVRDTASFAAGWPGKVLVAVVLIVIPAAMVLPSVGGGRYGRYADDSWKALLMLVVLAGTYLVSRRLLLTVLVAAVTVGGRVLGHVPEPGHRPQRRRNGPGAPGPASRLGHPGRLPGRRRRRGRPGRGPAGAAGRNRRRRHHPDGGRLDDQGDDRPGHRGRRGPRRDPHGRPRRHLPPAAEGLTRRHRHDARARHPHLRIRRVRRRNPAPRRLEGAAGPELLHRRQRADDRGDPGTRRSVAGAATPTPRWARPLPARPSRRQPT